MQIDIDYIHWPSAITHQLEFNNAIFESLTPSTEDMFIKRMENAFPGFDKYVFPNIFGFPLGSIPVMYLITEKYPLDALKERADAFSYNTTVTGNERKLIMFKPNCAPANLQLDDKYVHVSPVDNLDVTGIRCKASGRFEEYSPRIFLRPLSSLIPPGIKQDKFYDAVTGSCLTMAHMFNEKYLARGIIDKRESYYVYLVELPETFPVYKDTSYDKPSVYVLNNIAADRVRKIGFLVTP